MSSKLNKPVARLNLERLERREVPASLVTATLAGSVLTLVGGDDADVFTIRDDGVGVTVLAGGSTQIIFNSNTGGNLTIAKPVISIRVVGKGGGDAITLDGSTVVNLSGAFSADLGDGDNYFNFNPTQAGNAFGSFSYTGLAGSDQVRFGAVGVAATTVAGKFSAATGENNGPGALDLYGVTIKGPLTYAAKDGYDVIQMNAVVAEKDVSVALGDGSINGTSVVVIQDSAVKGNVTVTAGDYSEEVQLTATTISGKVGLTFNGGEGGATTVSANNLTLGAGGISVVAKNGTSAITAYTSLKVAKAVAVSNRIATLNTAGTATTGPLTVAGADVAHLTLNGDATVTGKVSALSTAGDAYVSLEGASAAYHLNGGVAITGASAATFYESTAGVIDVSGGTAVVSKNGPAAAAVNDVTFSGGLALTATTGPATLTVNTLGLTVNGPTAVTSFASATINDYATASVYNGSVGVTSANGFAAFNKPSAGAISVTGSTAIKGYDSAQLHLAADGARTFGKDVTLNSQVGTAYVYAFANSTAQTLFKGNVGVSGFGTAVYLNSENASSVAGNLTVAGAGGNDLVSWDSGFTVAGNATITAGKGTAAIDIGAAADPATEVKNLSITTGTGADVIHIYNVKVHGTTTINTGAGNDTLYLGENSTFTGAVAVDTGGNEDSLLVGYENNMSGPTTFAAKSTFKLGTGNDLLYLGRSQAAGGNTNSKAVFAVPGNVIDGGTGTNSFDDEAGQFDNDANLARLHLTDPT